MIHKHLSKPLQGILIGLAIAASVALFFKLPFAGQFNWKVYDETTRFFANKDKLPEDVVIVMVDEPSLKQVEPHAGRWPWRRSAHAALMASLHTSGAKLIVFDIMFAEESDPYHDDVLASYSSALKEKLVYAKLSTAGIYPGLQNAGVTFGLVEVAKEKDNVTRRAFTLETAHDSLAGKAYTLTSGKVAFAPAELLKFNASYESGWQKLSVSAGPLVTAGYPILDHIRKGTDEFDPVKVRAALQNLPKELNVKDPRFANKIVFVGANAAATSDTKATPLAGHEPGVIIHSTAFTNFREQSFIRTVPDVLVYLGSFLLATLILYMMQRLKQLRYQLASFLVLMSAVIIFSLISFRVNWWISPLLPGVCLFLSFSTGVALNYLEEYKKKQQIIHIFGRFVSKSVVEKLVANPDQIDLEGEERDCTIFFSDLAGFTDMSEKMTAKQLVKVINHYLDEMSRFILERDGTIDKFIGDAIMGFFNAPQNEPKHAILACEVALESQNRMDELNDTFMREYGVSLYVRFGIHTGNVVAGPIGSRERLDYTVLGDDVNIASRLEGANKPYGTKIMVSQTTHALAIEKFEFRPIDLIRLKGKQRPLLVYELLAYKGKLKDHMQKALPDFNEAFDSYRKGNFGKALEKFTLVSQWMPEDELTKVYLKRCREYIIQPPENWDGVYIMKEK